MSQRHFLNKKLRKDIIVCFLFILVSVSFLVFGNIKNNNFESLASIKNSYAIRALSSNISLDRFYSNQDELKIIEEEMIYQTIKKRL